MPRSDGSRPEAAAERQEDGVDLQVDMDGSVARDAEAVTQVLNRGMGYERSDAREMVAKSLAKLHGIGRRPTGDEILNTALTGRVVLFGASKKSSTEEFRSNPKGEASLHPETLKEGAEEERDGREGGPADGKLAS